MVNRIVNIFTLLLVLFSTSTAYAAELSVRASRTQISINESVSVELTAVGNLGEDPNLSVLNKDFEIAGQSQSSQVSIVNGDYSKSKVWSLTLLPKRSGTLIIPALCSGSDCSKPTTLIVREQSTIEQADATVILESEVSNYEVMVQQQLIYTIRLLIRQPLLQAGLGDITPEGVETTLFQLGDDVRYETERGTYRYQVIERNYALFPQQAGQLHLPPQRFSGQTQTNNRSRLSSRFDPFGQEGQTIRLRTKAIDVTVNEAPALMTHQTWLPATKFLIGDDWQQSPPTLTVGEPATRTIITTATGLTAAQLPELMIQAPNSFKSYPDQTMRQDQLEPTGVRGMMEQKVALVPTQAGTFTLPAIQLKWWDITGKKWRTQSTKEITVQVLPAQRETSTPAAVNVAAPPIPPTPPTQAVTEKTTTAPVSAPSVLNQLASRPIWLWVSILCASGWLITLILLWCSRKRKQSQPPAKGTEATATRPANKALAEVIRCAQSNDASQTRAALQVWITTIEPQSNIEHFTQHADEPLKTQIMSLNRALYSAVGGEAWCGDELAKSLGNWSSHTPKKEQSALPDFYPKS